MARTILITGCSDGGLGAALADAFHKRGDRVFATARNPSKMATLKAAGIETLQLDVLSDESVKRCVDEVSSLTGGSLDVLVNNAGAGYNMPVMDVSISEAQKLFELNVWAVVRTVQHFLPLLRQSKHGALIANNTSVNSVLSMPWQGSYNASKAAAAAITDTLRLELQPFGIKVVDLKTGAVKSKFFDNVTAIADAKLPETSMYAPARSEIEAVLAFGPELDFMDAHTWATRVAGDLSRSSPAYQIWRGAGATLGRLLTMLPLGTADFKLKDISGLKVLEQKLNESKKLR